MSVITRDHLYQLLPVVYRLRDAEQDEPLRALLSILSEELAAIQADISGLYENWFIETADEWVIPYIGDLLGVRNLTPITSTSFSLRAYVANTLYYRRRKGTAYVLERLARDVTGWPAQVVEFFELLQTTQYMNHIRLFNAMPDLRDTNRLNLLDTSFDTLPHTADVRHIYNRRGKHNIPNIGIFLWRLQNYPLQGVHARQAQAPNQHGYHFSPLGSPAPLFGAPAGAGAPEEMLVPAPVRPLAFQLDLKSFTDQFATAPTPPLNSRYYGPQRSLQILKDGTPVPPLEIMCKNLENWQPPPAGKVAVDVALGRIAFASGEEPASSVSVSFNYGFSADIGGGPYDRREYLEEGGPSVLEIEIGHGMAVTTLSQALTEWSSQGKPPAIFRFLDSGTYQAGETIDLPESGWLVLEAANGQRPLLSAATPLTVKGPLAPAGAEDVATLKLSGLLLEGFVDASGKLRLEILDCTLVPGRFLDEDGYPKEADKASLVVTGTDVTDLEVLVSRSLLGPLEMPAGSRQLVVRDSIIDAPRPSGAPAPLRAALAADAAATLPGPVTTLERCTVFGQVFVREMSLASEVIFTSRLVVERKQAGCVRFSFVPVLPDKSRTPRRFRCQPDLALADRAKELDVKTLPASEREQILLRVQPAFTAYRYGNPTYAQLSLACPDEIRTGAEHGSEMGAFSSLQQPQREANLRIALDEYLRFGLEAGIFFVT